MAVGGNGRARQFFKQHGWDELGADKIESKYTSRAAQLYRSLLEKEASKLSSPLAPTKSTTGDELADLHHVVEAVPEPPGEPLEAGAAEEGSSKAPAAPLVPKPIASAAAKKPGAKKPAGKLGLGLKKLENKVDESLFDQAPAEAPPPPALKPSDPLPGGALSASAAVTAASTAASPSRFSYDQLNAVEPPAASTVQRGKDGHLTLNNKGGDFFGPTSPSSDSNYRRATNDKAPGASQASSASTTSSIAQKKFGNVKAISSKDFEAKNQEK